jgi:uncharacterized membrane protein YgdD (TMEM256/DUF423 family)
MTLHPLAKKSLIVGAALLALGVLIGAFGAHGLKNIILPEKLVTFETGIRYHFYHSIGLMILGLVQQQFPTLRLVIAHWAFFIGVLLFSFNCYFYAITDIKAFALVVPLGGFLFTIGWITLMNQLLKLR